MGLELDTASQGFAFPFGAKLSGVRLTSTRSNPPSLLIESPAVRIAPSIVSLLMFHPGVRVNASIYDGVVNLALRQNGHATTVDCEFDGVNLAREHSFERSGVSATGILSGHTQLLLSSGGLEDGNGGGELNGSAMTIAPGAGIPVIRLGRAHAQFKLDGGKLTIQEFKTSGGDLEVSATGTILLAPDAAQSTLDVQFTLVPSPAAASQLATLFAMLPHPPGTRPYQLSGSLSAPRLS
ncbi:MAG TPA: type II secretion system protein GspN, partial [Candidatus Acidoferrales bacterium]|nr:type II secretion system protein GspN [Candidatus Acidoferrales bacterium]